jgi:hypothetical protein
MNPNPTWVQKGFAILFIVFCMELGLFLLIYPWTVPWQVNFIPAMIPAFRPIWLNSYLRGAVSGLGVLNLWIALIEIFRLRRFSR